jgi:hypothetical protein
MRNDRCILTVTRYLEGLLLLFAAIVPLHAASYLWRARLLGQWQGAPARLVEIISDLTVFVCVSEILGSVHLYRIAPVVLALIIISLVAIWLARRPRFATSQEDDVKGLSTSTDRPQDGSSSRGRNFAALVAVAVVIGEWSTKTVAAYHHGMGSTDTLWYHMPFAARFVQDGSITALHYVDSEPVTVFFPASSELFHSFGIMLMGNDVLSPIINTLWLGLALLAAWCIGRPFGVGAITLIGSAILFATPGLVGTQPGGAYDDIVGLALFLSSIALIVNCDGMSDRSVMVATAISAAAAGLAIGTKWTFIGPVLALTVGFWFLIPRGKRARSMALWLVTLVVVGGFWYGRNLFAIGNPLPPFHLKIGPFSLPSPRLTSPSSDVAQFLFKGSAWHSYFLPGLRISFGPAWWALLGLSAIGLVLACITGGRLLRILGLVGLASGVFFIVDPQYLVLLGAPVYFVDNVRYADAAVVLGLVLLPINPVLATARRIQGVLLAYLLILVATQFDAGIWPTNFFSDRFEIPVLGSDFVIGLALGVVVFAVGAVVLVYRAEPRRHHVGVLALVVFGCIAVLIAGFPLQQTYLRDRYSSAAGGPAYSWPRDHSNVRVGLVGTFLQYPMYGTTDSNYVQYLGVRGPHGSFTTKFPSCRIWRQTIAQGRYDYVIITSNIVKSRSQLVSKAPPQMKWMGIGTDSRIVLQKTLYAPAPVNGYALFTVYKIDPRFSTEGCDDRV